MRGGVGADGAAVGAGFGVLSARQGVRASLAGREGVGKGAVADRGAGEGRVVNGAEIAGDESAAEPDSAFVPTVSLGVATASLGDSTLSVGEPTGSIGVFISPSSLFSSNGSHIKRTFPCFRTTCAAVYLYHSNDQT